MLVSLVWPFFSLCFNRNIKTSELSSIPFQIILYQVSLKHQISWQLVLVICCNKLLVVPVFFFKTAVSEESFVNIFCSHILVCCLYKIGKVSTFHRLLKVAWWGCQNQRSFMPALISGNAIIYDFLFIGGMPYTGSIFLEGVYSYESDVCLIKSTIFWANVSSGMDAAK